MDVEKIIDKLRKLIRHEESARKIGNTAEAAAFAGKIQTLLIEHKISADQVNTDDVAAPKIGREKAASGRTLRYGDGACVPLEDNRLMAVVGTAYFCRALVIPRSNLMYVFGEDEDRAVCVEMFRFLARTMKRLAREEHRRVKQARKSTRRFKPHFYAGFTHALNQRYTEMRRQAEGESTALIRTEQAVELYVEQFVDRRPERPRKHVRINRHAYFAGVARGHEVSLATNVMEGQS